jgi:hypothetical protein
VKEKEKEIRATRKPLLGVVINRIYHSLVEGRILSTRIAKSETLAERWIEQKE